MNWITLNRPARIVLPNVLHMLLLCAAMSSLSGCAELVYDSLHEDRRAECNKMVNTDERAACIKRHQQSFEAYEKERIKLLQSK